MNPETTAGNKRALSRSSIVLICLFAAYAVLTFIGAANHEVWFDETQAWAIVRDNDIAGIIAAMKAEGHPPLWHFVLYPFTRLGFSADILPFISWFITLIAAGLMVWKAPFKPAMKGIILFSGGFIFYNSIISRVYCLILLLLTLIAITYKHRNRRPIIYGLLVGLLADTHIMMSGLVGILGIYMIIDLIKGWKDSSGKNNICKLLGLIIAGFGVIGLVLPTLGSVGANDFVSSRSDGITFGYILNKALGLFKDITQNSVFDGTKVLIQHDFTASLCWILGFSFIIMLVLMRHHKRELFMCLGFTAFFFVSSELLWVNLPMRAEIYLYTYAILYWFAQSEKSEDKTPAYSQGGSKILQWLRNRDRECDRSFCAVFCFFSALTIPMGMAQLINDYANDFSYSKAVAEFIKNELPSDSVFIIENNNYYNAYIVYPTYITGHKFYSLADNKFITYSEQKAAGESEKIDCQKLYNDLKDYQNIYMMNFSYFELDPGEYPEVLLNRHGTFSTWTTPSDQNINLYRIDLEKFIAEAASD